jgi:outer membrane protein OmpA-like peptidoglycan-associated protein
LARIVLVGIVLTALLAFSREPASSDDTGRSQAALPATPYLRIQRDLSGISVAGQVSSVAHEAILRDVIGRLAPAAAVSFDVHLAELLPPGWALVTELALRATLWTRFSHAEVTASGVSIRGVTADADAWDDARSRLGLSLLSGMQLETRVIELPSLPDYEKLCHQQFDAVLKTRTLEFAVAMSTLESGAEALLDSLIETAADCPGAVISIRASGDGPESVTANRILSEARLQAIVDYLTGHGLSPARINALPAADSNAARARPVSFAVSFVDAGDGRHPAATASP